VSKFASGKDMSLDWDLIWKILQVVALLIIAREIDKRWRKRKNK
jgi:hypothetical protein